MGGRQIVVFGSVGANQAVGVGNSWHSWNQNLGNTELKDPKLSYLVSYNRYS